MRPGKRTARASAVAVALCAAVAVGTIISSAMPDRKPAAYPASPGPPPAPVLPVGAASHPWVFERHGVAKSFAALTSINVRLLRIDALWAGGGRGAGPGGWG